MIAAVVAVRKGSQRIPNKNIKPFGKSNLLDMKLDLLKSVRNIDEIIVNSDCDKMLDIGLQHGVSIHKRSEYFASSECSNSEFHGHIAEVTNSDTIFLAPVCSPFVSIKSHEKAIELYLNGFYDKKDEIKFDSTISVTEVKNHLWLNNEPINYDLNNVPNSQDLPDVVKLNYGITITDKKIMQKYKRVVGNAPAFYKLDEIESQDVDTPFDWLVAEAIYKKKYNEK
tara:strand:+ start:8085 stop:8762 length:678 start_codon:yes stop_codon:yes gene_type:complete